MSFISFKEGSPKDHLHLQVGKERTNQLPVKFPANSVAPCNEVWNIGNRTFVQILLQLCVLSSIQQLLPYAIAFWNVLASNQRAAVEEATYNPLICYESSLWTKNQPATVGSVVERSSQLAYAQQGLGSSLQLMEHQVGAEKSLLSGPLRQALEVAPENHHAT
jgi:hypothetical protein